MLTEPQADASHYTYRVAWSGEDREFVATCPEFPSLSWLAETQRGALEGLEELLRAVIVELEQQGEPIPVSLSERHFSGRFNVRVGEQLHRELATHAAEDGMSLNQYIVRKLAAG